MKRITVSIPDEIAEAVEREARRRRVPVSEIAREAFAARVNLGAQNRGLSFANLGRSGRTDTARRIEEILADEWASGPRRRGRR